MESKKTHPKPTWLKVNLPNGEGYKKLKSETRRLSLSTVCEEAKCPNIAECWQEKTLSVMIMGDTCTRFCRFCNVKTGNPKGFLNPSEPENTARLLKPLNLRYVVITSVDRDDLLDGGAQHFADTIKQVRAFNPNTTIEVLTGDFQGNYESIDKVIRAFPQVISHNVETVPRLTSTVRDRRASFERSLLLLKRVKETVPSIYTKSSLMVGLGESYDEVIEVMDKLREIKVDLLTIGQYLQPSPQHLPVDRYLTPAEFKNFKKIGLKKGFLMVSSGPLVRSSYKAGEVSINGIIKNNLRHT